MGHSVKKASGTVSQEDASLTTTILTRSSEGLTVTFPKYAHNLWLLPGEHHCNKNWFAPHFIVQNLSMSTNDNLETFSHNIQINSECILQQLWIPDWSNTCFLYYDNDCKCIVLSYEWKQYKTLMYNHFTKSIWNICDINLSLSVKFFCTVMFALYKVHEPLGVELYRVRDANPSKEIMPSCQPSEETPSNEITVTGVKINLSAEEYLTFFFFFFTSASRPTELWELPL